MRSADIQQLGLFSYVSVGARVPTDHPVRTLRELVDGVLREMDGLFEARYAKTGRPSIPRRPRCLMCWRCGHAGTSLVRIYIPRNSVTPEY